MTARLFNLEDVAKRKVELGDEFVEVYRTVIPLGAQRHEDNPTKLRVRYFAKVNA